METLLAAALASLIIMNSVWFQRYLERRVIAGLESLTGCRVEIGQFRFKPWLFQITLQKLVLHGLEASGNSPLVSVGDMEVGLSPGQFLHPRLRLRYVDLNGLQVHVRANPQGVSNIPVPRQPTSTQEGLAGLMDLSIRRLTLSHCALFWNDQSQPVELDARDLAVLLRLARGRYSGSISSSATSVRSSRWASPPIKFNGRFELSPATLVFSSFAWQAKGTAGQAYFTITLQPKWQVSGSFHASAELPAWASVLHAPELRAGTLQIDGLAAYQGGMISAEGRAQARRVVILTPSFPALLLETSTNYVLKNHQLDLTNLLVSVWGGTMQGGLQVNFQDAPPRFHLTSQIHQVRLDNLLRSASTPPHLAPPIHPASEANGALNATWSGRWENLQADFDLALQAPVRPPPNVLPVSGRARGDIEDGRGLTLHLADAEFRTPHSTITAHGTITQSNSSLAPAEALAITIVTDNFDEWRPFFQTSITTPSDIPLELKSRGEFSGQLSGSYKAPILQGRVNLGPFRFQGLPWDRLTATITLGPGFVQISDGRVQHDRSSLELDSSAQLDHWQLTPGSVVHLSARAQRTPIEGLESVINLNLPLRGLISGHVDIEGITSNLAGSGSLRMEAGAFADEPFDTFSTQLRVAHSIWKLPNIQLTKNHGRMSGEATVEPGRRFASGRLAGTNFHLADIHRLPVTASLAFPKGRMDGNLSFEAQGQGTPENFHLQGSWRIENWSVAGTSLGECQGTLAGEGNQLRLAGEEQSPGGNFHFSAQATAQGDWPMEAEGEYSNLRADPWIRAFFNREFAAAVTLGGSFQARGPLRDPARIDLQSHATVVAVDFPSVQWRNVQPVDVHYAAGRLTLDRFVMQGPSTELEVAGAVDLTHGVVLALSAEGSANASLLTVFDPKLQATGRSTLHLRLTGTPARPFLNGTMEIQDVSLDYSGLPFRFTSLQGAIRLEGERAVISSLRGTCGGGNVALSGFVTLVEKPRYEVRADLSQVRVRYPASFTSVLDGHLRLAGGVESAQLLGELVVRQMVLNQNINFIAKIIESSNSLIEAAPTVDSPVASMIRLNVHVTSSPPVQVQTPNFRLTGDIDIRLQGTVANPVQVGSIHLLRGESVFRSNRYTLVRGDLNMTNPFRTQAYLDLEAETHVQSYNLTIDITGPLDRLKFSYRSDPPLANTDIISLLALGYVRQEQAFSTAGGNPAATVGATALLSEALSSQTTSRIQHLFGVSRIKIDPNVAVPGYGSGARVTVEQQVSHDLTLTYVTDTSYSQYRIIQFEWNINDNVSVLGVRDQNGVFGIEFRFRRRFK